MACPATGGAGEDGGEAVRLKTLNLPLPNLLLLFTEAWKPAVGEPDREGLTCFSLLALDKCTCLKAHGSLLHPCSWLKKKHTLEMSASVMVGLVFDLPRSAPAGAGLTAAEALSHLHI